MLRGRSFENIHLCANHDEAVKIKGNDPAVKSGIMNAELFTYTIA